MEGNMLRKVLKKGSVKPKTLKNDSGKKTASTGNEKLLKPLSGDIYEIKARAYELYRKRSQKGRPGDELGDWVVAEKEIREEFHV
jgi:hypothetical protein